MICSCNTSETLSALGIILITWQTDCGPSTDTIAKYLESIPTAKKDMYRSRHFMKCVSDGSEVEIGNSEPGRGKIDIEADDIVQ